MMLTSLWLAVATPAPDAAITASDVASIIPAEVRLAEAIAVDGGRLITGSVVDGGLWRQTRAGWRKARASLPAGPVLALAVDRRARRLWVSIGTAEPYSGAAGFRGLVGLSLPALREVRRVTLPDGASPADISVAADGTLYISDSVGGGVYRCSPGCNTAERLIGKEAAPSPQGIAPAPGGHLYLADYERGLLRVDPRTGAVEALGNPSSAELRGIDGLVWWRGQLIGVQNGTRTRRILRIALGAGGRTATSVTPIEQGHPEWGEPTLAALDGNKLFYIADAQWEAWEKGGARKAGVPPRPTPVRRIDLRP